MKIKALISSPFAAAALFVLLFPAPARADDDMAIMPLSEIRPGMTGEWHTVVSGSRIDSFPMQVVGIAENFIGPQRPVIICKALDAANKLTGPVAGMSGSPVFINGKLIGAYAYGFTWPKDQALIGVTPIESMLEVETNYPPAGAPAGQRTAWRAMRESRRGPAMAGGAGERRAGPAHPGHAAIRDEAAADAAVRLRHFGTGAPEIFLAAVRAGPRSDAGAVRPRPRH